MKAFTDLYLALDATTSTTSRVRVLEAYFREVPPEDGAWAIAFLTGNRPKGTTSSNAVRELAIERAGIPRWLFDESRAAVGDLSETIVLVLPDPPTDNASPPSLHDVVESSVLPLVGASHDVRKRLIGDALSALDRDQRFVYLKMLRGGFRIGVQRRLLARALANIARIEPAMMEHRLAGGTSPTAQDVRRLLGPVQDDELGRRPYPFFLAHPIELHTDTIESTLGDPRSWFAEWKWDGVRVQIAKRGDEILLWSRGEELITHLFPEIASGASFLPNDTVLDAELLIWERDRPASFADLQTRLNRTRPPAPQLGLFDARGPVLLAFDAIEHDGVDLRDRPQAERRAVLDSLLDGRAGVIRPSPLIAFETWAALEERRAESRARGVEGLVLKHRDTPYLAGRVRPESSPGWLKWKIEPRTVDAVLVHALPGSGRRATLYTDYAFAVWSEDRSELVVFARAYSGLDRAEIERLDAWIRSHTTARKGPVRMVAPERVFEIGFEGLARSARHRSGIAVRFPRILRERPDKRPEDADTLGTLQDMLPSR